MRQENDGVAESEGPTQLHSECLCFRVEGPETQKDIRNIQTAPSYIASHQRLTFRILDQCIFYFMTLG